MEVEQSDGEHHPENLDQRLNRKRNNDRFGLRAVRAEAKASSV